MDQPAAPYFDEPVVQSLRQPFRMQRVFARSFTAFGRSFFPFMMLGVVVYLPLLIYLGAVLGDDAMFIDAIDVWKAVLAVGGGLLSLLLTATVIYGTFCQLRGEPTSVGRSIGVGLRRLLPVLGVGIVTGIIIVLGFIALIVPGFILYCMLFAAIPVAVVERTGVGDSLSRSAELTKGHRWPIFGIVLLLGLGNGVATYVIEQIFLGTPTASSVKTYMVVSILWSIVVGVFGAVVTAVSYHDLRAAKETVDLDHLTSVFE